MKFKESDKITSDQFSFELNYSQVEIDIATFTKALSHPARIRIVQFLLQINNCFAGDISEVLPVGSSTVSEHLRLLKAAGIIQGVLKPPHIKYCICSKNKTKIKKILKTLESL